MNFEVHFSSAAEADIDQIFDYISITLCSPIAAQNLMAKFQESVNTLSDFPEAFALCQEEPWILRDVRSNFIVLIMTNEKSIYCAFFITDKKRSSH